MSAPAATAAPAGTAPHKILVLDVGGSHVKMLRTGQTEPTKFDSGKDLTAAAMVAAVKEATAGWEYDAVSMGVPAPVVNGRLVRDPVNLGPGWADYAFDAAFGKPIRIVNDATMQAVGSYAGGRMLFLGLGTGLGAALVDHGYSIGLEIAHLPYKQRTYEEYLGARALKRAGHDRWERRVHRISERLCDAFVCDYVMLGGGNAKRLDALPPRGRLGDNANAFTGGFRLWETAMTTAASPTLPNGSR